MKENSSSRPDPNLTAYKTLSLFYHDLVLPRGHFEKQASVIQTVMNMEGLTHSTRLLDAACGTGDVARVLFKRGFHRLDALDGSPEMLRHAKQGEANPISFSCIQWQNLPDYFTQNGRYDLIFIMGNSISHLNNDSLMTLLRAMHTGLSERGILLFDLRPWELNREGLLREPGRPTGVFRLLGKAKIEEHVYWLDEVVHYNGNVQAVKYRLRSTLSSTAGNEAAVETSVYYHIFDHEEAKTMLSLAGFRGETWKFEDWPYLVLVARK